MNVTCVDEACTMDMLIFLLIFILALLPHTCSTGEPQEALELHGVHPSFLPSPTYYLVEVGKVAVLECAVIDLNDRRVIWKKASDPNPLTVGRESFYNTDRIVIEHQPRQNKWNLVIRDVQLSDSGVYECQVSSRLRHLKHLVLLRVEEKDTITTPMPRPDIKLTGSSFVERNDQIYLICNATGLEHPPDDLDWFLNGNKLTTKDNNKVSIRKFVSITARTIVSILEIQDAQLEDSGMYVCRTSNLQIKHMQVTVLNADSYNVKRGTVAGNNDKSRHSKGKSGGYSSKDNNSARAQVTVLHRHLLASVVMVITLTGYWLFPS